MSLSPSVVQSAPTNYDLSILEQRVKQDLRYLCYPVSNWIPPTQHPSVQQVYDVIVIGGGMCGLVASFALLSSGIANIRIFDRSESGLEGPWVTYARMETLRSPKQLTGPAYGMASLTFRAWFEAQHGEPAWQKLDKIPRIMWMDYLRWYRQVLDLPVENNVNVDEIKPQDGLLRLELSGSGAKESFILTRKVVLATGREGLGYPNIPDFMAELPPELWVHSSADIDFNLLRDKRVVVIGAGASAVENAAEALEASAAEVRLLIRRKEMPRVNKMKGATSFGFSAGFPVLDDAWRWRIIHYSFVEQTPAPHLSTLRVSRHKNAYFHFDAGVKSISTRESEVLINTVHGVTVATDFVILGTGFIVDPGARKELGDAAEQILLWRDRYLPPAELAHPELNLFPYLAADFSFQEREIGAAPWLQHIHCFNYGATVSLGKISGDIPAVSEGAQLLAQSLAANFYRTDIEKHWQALKDYDEPELLGYEWTPSELAEFKSGE